MRFYFLFFCLLLQCTAPVLRAQQGNSGQSKAQLEAKRKELQDAINQTERELAEIKKNKNASVSQLRALQYKLAQRQTLINNINDEINSIDHSIASSSKEIVTLKQTLEQLKEKYAQTVRYSYETRSSYDLLAFVFSSADFNDAVRRMKYLKNFRAYRKQQVDRIHQAEDQLHHKIGDLNKEKAEKDDLLVTQKNQNQALVNDVRETQHVVQELKGREKELQREAEKNKKIAAQVDKAIRSIIGNGMKAATKRGKASGGGKTLTVASGETPTLMLTPTDVALANNFEGNKGKLYWPVTQGYISSHFGVHKSAWSPYVDENNDGVTIRTSAGAPVRAVFEGTVGKITSVVGIKVVIVQHGNYFTIYNNLASTSVTEGQHVSTLQTIGVVGENFDGEPTINFQVWKAKLKGGSDPINPEAWLGKLR